MCHNDRTSIIINPTTFILYNAVNVSVENNFLQSVIRGKIDENTYFTTP